MGGENNERRQEGKIKSVEVQKQINKCEDLNRERDKKKKRKRKKY